MTIGLLVTSLTKALLPTIAQLVDQNLMMEATVFLGTFNAADICWYTSPDLCLDTILSQSSRDNSFDLMAWILL